MAKNKRLSPMDIAIISTMVAKLCDEHMVTLSVDAGGAFITASPNFPPERYEIPVNIEEAPEPINVAVNLDDVKKLIAENRDLLKSYLFSKQDQDKAPPHLVGFDIDPVFATHAASPIQLQDGTVEPIIYGNIVTGSDMVFSAPDDELEIPSFLKRGDDKIKTKKASYLETSEYMENGVIKPLDVNILRDRMLSGSKIYLVLRTNTIDTEAVVVKYIIETQNGDTIISTTENVKFKLKQE